MKIAKFIFLILTLGCTVGPKYEPPCVEIPPEWSSPHSNTNEYQTLNDPQLDWLLEYAMQSNLDLYLAASRILEARRMEKGAQGALYPRLDGSATYANVQYNQKALDRLLGTISKNSGNRNVNLFEIGFDAEWEIDFFGKNVHDIAAAKAKREAIEEDYEQIWITLSAEIAKTYFQFQAFQGRLDLLDKSVISQQEMIQLTRGLSSAGFSDNVAVLEGEALLKGIKAQRPELELGRQMAQNRLAVLLGLPPGQLCLHCCQLPCVPEQNPVGIPSELLRRRPDIHKAERELAAATELVGSAIAALFPRISLRGFIGDFGTTSTGGFTSFVGPQILQPIFNSRLLEQDVDLSKIKVQQALYTYQKTVLEALEEAENAIAAFHYGLEKNRYLGEAMEANWEGYKSAKQLYETGFKDYVSVLAAKRAYLLSEDAFLQSKEQLLILYVALYKSLGCNFQYTL